ncbi:MAG: di-heme oxidoredictase family protein [Akkermansiaceae bacterium]
MKYFLISLLSIIWGNVFGQEHHPEYFSGGDTTVFIESNKAFSRPLANITSQTLRHHSIGNSFFNQNWIEAPASAEGRDGLGPLFNARSCSACHPHDGKGHPQMKGLNKIGMITRLSIPGISEYGHPIGDPRYGTQLSDFSLPSLEPEAKINIKYVKTLLDLGKGQSVSLRQPVVEITDLHGGALSEDAMQSTRLAPAVYGMGLINELADETLLSFADPEDHDGDGISGRPNYVWDIERQQKAIGRFGWKASQPSLKQQIADAFVNDIGITSSLFTQENTTEFQHEELGYGVLESGGSPEVSDKILERVTTYLASIAPPARRNVGGDTVRRGKNIFHEIQCAACHIPEMKTRKDASLPELADQTIRPYSDFLLHDMGEGLADNRADFEASGKEWRTPPLWGIGLQNVVSRHSFFLHDGRAQNVIEAILWHGGEAANSRDQFMMLSQVEKKALFDFLMSL